MIEVKVCQSMSKSSCLVRRWGQQNLGLTANSTVHGALKADLPLQIPPDTRQRRTCQEPEPQSTMRFITDPKVPPWDVQLNTVPKEVKIASDSDVQMGILGTARHQG